MDSATERRLREELRELARLLAVGDVEAFGTRLTATVSPDLIRAAREGKLILKADRVARPGAAAVMIDVAGTVLSATERDMLARHLELIILTGERSDRFEAGVQALVSGLPVMPLVELLRIAQRAFDRFAKQFMDSEKRWHDPGRSVGLVEREWHDFNGRIADVTAATCRAVNAAAGCRDDRRTLRDDKRASAERTMVKIVSLCSVLNGLDWVRDSTAFGDLDVTSITAGETPEVTFQFRDPRRSLLRTLGTRREVVMETFARRSERVVTRWLEHNSEASLGNAVERHLATVRNLAGRTIDAEALWRSADMHLNGVDFEDDMVLMASEGDREILGRYLLSSMLQWSEIAAHAVAKSLPKATRRRFLPAPIALADLIDDLTEPDWRDVLATAWAEATIELPVANHWDLVRRPFVLQSPGVALPLLHGATGKWNASIRERLLRDGSLGKKAGAGWERYFADRFREGGWEVLGEGVRLRSGKAILTDVDLLVARDDLLLVVQVKAMGGAALNPYDHWKHRKVVEKGCWQASVAYRHLSKDLSVVQAVAGRRAAERVRRVEPVVLTNVGQFDGWEHDGVPVLAETLLKSITVGSKVDYVDSKEGHVVSTRHLLRREDLTTETIIGALRSPIELAIAPETGAVAHLEEQVAGILFRIPEFTVPADSYTPPAATATGG